MRKVTLPLALLAAFSTLAFADNWSGRLLDASCYDQAKKADGCDATSRITKRPPRISRGYKQMKCGF